MTIRDRSGEWWYTDGDSVVYRCAGDAPAVDDPRVGAFADPADAEHAAACVTIVGGLVAAGMWPDIAAVLGEIEDDEDAQRAELLATDGYGRTIL